jgi:hypothetical protein
LDGFLSSFNISLTVDRRAGKWSEFNLFPMASPMLNHDEAREHFQTVAAHQRLPLREFATDFAAGEHPSNAKITHLIFLNLESRRLR